MKHWSKGLKGRGGMPQRWGAENWNDFSALELMILSLEPSARVRNILLLIRALSKGRSTCILTYIHPPQEALRHFIFLFNLFGHTYIKSSLLFPACYPKIVSDLAFSCLPYSVPLWFIYMPRIGWWCPTHILSQYLFNKWFILGILLCWRIALL